MVPIFQQSMTHGVGSLGHGGGHHGGFHRFNHNHFTPQHRGHLSEGSGEDCGECCCLLCSLIGFLLCLAKMKRRTRIVLVDIFYKFFLH